LVIICCCADNRNYTSFIESIDIVSAFNSRGTILLSEIAEDIEYIPLETTHNSILASPNFEITDENIIVRDIKIGNQILLFSRQDGKFIKEIYRSGRGPDEYGLVPLQHFFNYKDGTFYVYSLDTKYLCALDINGETVRKIKFPEWEDPAYVGGMVRADYGTNLEEGIYLCKIPNYSGVETKKVMIYANDTILKIFPNYLQWGRNNGTITRTKSIFSTNFFKWNDQVFFKELFNDTIFRVTKDTILPRILFYCGKFSFPYDLQGEILRPNNVEHNYFLILDIAENQRYIFFQLLFRKQVYTCFYDKIRKITRVGEHTGTIPSAFIDDITGFLPFTPEKTTLNNEIIGTHNASEIMRWIDNNPKEAYKLKHRFNWLNDINEFSNPVIVIAKSK